MAKPTEAQIRALEKAHKTQLANILQAIAFRRMIYLKLGANNPDWQKYADFVFKNAKQWVERQNRLEKGGATKEGIVFDDFIKNAGVEKLKGILKKWDAKGEGIGFIPLLIWAVVAIVGMFTAEEIVDEMNNTTEEQAELINTSQDICQKYNWNAEECKKFITQQTEAAQSSGGIFGGIGKPLLLLGLGYLIITNSDKIFKSKKTQST